MDKIIKQLSPLTEATFYILIALSEPLHGYGIIKKVEVMSHGRIKLAAGTLYGAINSLQKNELIILIGTDEDNPRRKIYEITAKGKALAEYEIKRLIEMANHGEKEIGEML